MDRSEFVCFCALFMPLNNITCIIWCCIEKQMWCGNNIVIFFCTTLSPQYTIQYRLQRSLKCQKKCKLTYSNCLFCLTTSPKISRLLSKKTKKTSNSCREARTSISVAFLLTKMTQMINQCWQLIYCWSMNWLIS